MDHASTTPIDSEVLNAMNLVYKNNYFNPGGLYKNAVATSNIISDSRKSVAKLLGTTSEHVIFSRGGTESNNMAILGVINKFWETHPSASQSLGTSPSQGRKIELPHVIVSEIEHAAVLETVKYLEREQKISLSLAPVGADGIVDLKELKKLLRAETVLVSIMYVNNEIGTVQPIREIAKLVRWFKKQNTPSAFGHSPYKGETAWMYPLVHIDAIQAVNYLDLNVEKLGVDLMSLSGSKMYGPKSSGILYVRNKNLISSIFHGGDQEFGLRSGTPDIAQIVGFSKAFEIARSVSDQESKRLGELQNYFFSELKKNIPELIINGAAPFPWGRVGDGSVRICNNINITIPNISGERLVIELDAKGISASSKSACKEDNGEESHVIAAIRKSQSHPASFGSEPLLEGEGQQLSTDGSLRFTMGREMTRQDVEKTVLELAKIVEKIRGFEDLTK